MKWSVRLGSAFGIPVYLHVTFLLLLGFIALSQGIAAGSPGAALGGVFFVLAIFGCVLLHEFGHALAARRFGIATRDVTLLPIGGLARLERMPDDPRQELWVAVAGPAVNVAIAGLLGIWLFLTGAAPAAGLGFSGGSFAGQLMTINLALVAFNMLPAFPMDGGRVLRALLAQRTSYVAATELAAKIGKGMALLFGIVGLLWNPMLLFIAIVVWSGAAQEAEIVRRRSFVAEPPIYIRAPRYDVEDPPPAGGWRRIGPWLVYRDE